jgi:hypothetical protein
LRKFEWGSMPILTNLKSAETCRLVFHELTMRKNRHTREVLCLLGFRIPLSPPAFQ